MTHPVEELREEIPLVPPSLQGVVAQTDVIPGTAFFPGGWGLWGTQANQPLPAAPVGGIMIVGLDFDSEVGFKRSLERGYEVEVRPDGTFDASPSPTWRALLDFLGELAVKPSDCFFTNAYMGLRTGVINTGQSPGAMNAAYRSVCQTFFLRQVGALQPRLVVTLGTWVPAFVAELAPELAPWAKVKTLEQLDAAGPVSASVRFQYSDRTCRVVALTHPSYRRLNVGVRRYGRLRGADAEREMMLEALRGET